MAVKKRAARQTRDEWRTLSAAEQAQANLVYETWERILQARNQAEDDLCKMLRFRDEQTNPNMRAVAEAEAFAFSDRIDMLDLMAMRAAPSLNELQEDFRWINERRNRVKAVKVFQHVFIAIKKGGFSVDDIAGMWRIQCAMAATPLPQRNPTEDQVEAGFSRFKRAIGCSEAQEMLDLGNGPKAAAIAAVAHAHGASVTVVKSQLRSLRTRREHQRREHEALLEEDHVISVSARTVERSSTAAAWCERPHDRKP